MFGGGATSRSNRSFSSTSAASSVRSRKLPAPAPSIPSPKLAGARPTTPLSVRPPSRLSVSPAATSTNSPIQSSDVAKAKENVSVTVRFRPLSSRELNKGDEVAWYADGDNTVRNEYNPAIAYGFDRVFGPATTTRHVYDIAAQNVIRGSMEGINGTVFAYGVTSSGKTHTMHGEQKSPGVIPLAVKDVFGIIQETPEREFLLRVSYMEIYNEVINDLLDPTGQNLRIREDSQGTYVEGIKEEVVLSPAHALSLIATGEEHRHVGSNNFNLFSSRSHTIFTLTIESSPHGEDHNEEDVTLSQLHLIDLAGSESSKTETTGVRRKEGSYINKSLLTLGTVISKLTDEKSTHIPYRDSKLTRLLQSSLSGHGRVSLICTVTPASSNTEETHNTLKFAHRSKYVEIKASQNKIMDEKSLIKKYQREISSLKHELQQLKRGIMENPNAVSTQEDLVNLKMQLEAGQVKLQSRLEEEEEAKAALMSRIQRLTKLILVSTKNTLPTNVHEQHGHRRRHSFGEDELAYLPDKKREYAVDDDSRSYGSEIPSDARDMANLDELVKDFKRNRRRGGMLSWFKLKKPEYMDGLSPTADSESSGSGSPASGSTQGVMFSDMKDAGRKSVGRRGGDDSTATESCSGKTQAGDLFSAASGNRRPPPSGSTITDQMDLLREQLKMLAGEVALSTSSLKRLSEQVANNPKDSQIREKIRRLKDEIAEKKLQMRILEQRMIGSFEMTPDINNIELSQALSKLTTQLNEKTFELEIKSADNRILQEQLQMKLSENAEMQETILLLRQQLGSLSNNIPSGLETVSENGTTSLELYSDKLLEKNLRESQTAYGETYVDENTPKSVMSLNRVLSLEDSNEVFNSQVYMQAAEIEDLKQDRVRLTEEKDGLEVQNTKLAEEASYAKELAAAAAVELRNLAEEVTKLSYENAQLSAAKEGQTRHFRQNTTSRVRFRKSEDDNVVDELQKELNARVQKEATLEKALIEREKIECDLKRRLDDATSHGEHLENELAKSSRSKLRNGHIVLNGRSGAFKDEGNRNNVDDSEDLKLKYQKEKKRCEELERCVSRLKGDDLAGLHVTTLEELQTFHVDAITKISHAKCTNHFL